MRNRTKKHKTFVFYSLRIEKGFCLRKKVEKKSDKIESCKTNNLIPSKTLVRNLSFEYMSKYFFYHCNTSSWNKHEDKSEKKEWHRKRKYKRKLILAKPKNHRNKVQMIPLN